MLTPLQQLVEGTPAPVMFAIGIAMLLGGGHWLVEGAVRLARRLGVSTLLIGLTIVAFGTSAPELSFNIISAVSGSSDLSFGNVVGSNIANISLVLGLAALIRPLDVHSRVIQKELPFLLAASIAMVAMGWAPMSQVATGGAIVNGFARVDGIIMLCGFGGMTWLWYRLGKRDRADPLTVEAETEAAEEPPEKVGPATIQLVVGLLALLGGGKLTEVGAVGIAESWGMAQTAVGLTMVALVTSLPEVVTSIIAARRGHGDLAVGNVIGSNMFNILLVLGATTTISPIALPGPWGGWDLTVMVAMTIALLPIAMTNQQRVTRWEGGGLLTCYLVYVGWTLMRGG